MSSTDLTGYPNCPSFMYPSYASSASSASSTSSSSSYQSSLGGVSGGAMFGSCFQPSTPNKDNANSLFLHHHHQTNQYMKHMIKQQHNESTSSDNSNGSSSSSSSSANQSDESVSSTSMIKLESGSGPNLISPGKLTSSTVGSNLIGQPNSKKNKQEGFSSISSSSSFFHYFMY